MKEIPYKTIEEIISDLYYIIGRSEQCMDKNKCIVSEIDVIPEKAKHAVERLKPFRDPQIYGVVVDE
jgi:hypothetical protein